MSDHRREIVRKAKRKYYHKHRRKENKKRAQRRRVFRQKMMLKTIQKIPDKIPDKGVIPDRLQNVGVSGISFDTNLQATGTYDNISSAKQGQQNLGRDTVVSNTNTKDINLRNNILILNTKNNKSINTNEISLPKNSLAKMREVTKRERSEKRKNAVTHKKDIHNRTCFNNWRSKKVGDWNCPDFFGYYLNKYFEVYGNEDISFVGMSEKKMAGWMVQIRNFLEKIDDNKQECRDYVDWIFKMKRDPAFFANGALNFSSVFVFANLYKCFKYPQKEIDSNLNRTKIEADLGVYTYGSFHEELWHKFVIGTRSKMRGCNRVEFVKKYYKQEGDLYDKIVPLTITKENYKSYLVDFLKAASELWK